MVADPFHGIGFDRDGPRSSASARRRSPRARHHRAAAAVEAIQAALDDAGLTIKDVDGLARFDIENVNELALVYGMGIPHLRFFAGVPSGGGAVCGTLVLAAMAIATGQANVVVCYRARNRGKQSSHGAKPLQGGRPWAKHAAALTDVLPVPRAVRPLTPAQEMA